MDLTDIRRRLAAEDPGVDWGAEHRIWYRYDVALLLTEIERLRTAVNAVYGWTKQGDSTPDKLRVALLLVILLEENNETA